MADDNFDEKSIFRSEAKDKISDGLEGFDNFEEISDKPLPDADDIDLIRNKILQQIEDEEEKNLTEPDFTEETTGLDAGDNKPDFQDNDIEESLVEPSDNAVDDISYNADESEKNSNNKSNDENNDESDDTEGILKKYIVYVSQDYVPFIDNLTLDERSAFINDALEMKIASEDKKSEFKRKKRLLIHLTVAFLTVCLLTPIALFASYKSIITTLDNYKYSQENFEKLYRQKFEHDRAYMRSLEYNKMLEQKMKRMSK